MDRLEVIKRVVDRRMSQRKAAEILGLSERQVRRVLRAFEANGALGLASKKRGRRSNRKLPEKTKLSALELVRERYSDFGPTLAREKLNEKHGFRLSVDTVRRWMVADEIWAPKSKRRDRCYQPRPRQACLGQLVQIDGCDHHWFEGRGPPCTLLVYVDDATGRLMELRFVRAESTFDYFDATESYLRRHGKPVAFYSDRLSVFRVAKTDGTSGRPGISQFGRAMNELNIEIICANSPQAKGRVERANLTLQDRLVKEMRLRGISSAEQGQKFLPEFIEDYNHRFAKQARNPFDAHRPLLEGDQLREIFTWQEERKISKELVVHYKRIQYVIKDTEANRSLRGKTAHLHENEGGDLQIKFAGRTLEYSVFNKDNAHIEQSAIIENKLLAGALAFIADKQKAKDLERLQSKKMSLREKERLRKHHSLPHTMTGHF